MLLQAGVYAVQAALLLLLHVLEPALAFNLDPQSTLRKDGDPGSLFGLSLTFHQQLRPDKVLLLIGAPRAKAFGSQKSKVTGGLYKCEISQSNTCERVDFDNGEDLENESKEDQWMGVTVRSQGPGGKIVTCAHRYERRGSVGQSNEQHSIIGRCYIFSQDLTINPKADEDGGNWNFCDGRDKSHEKFGYCQQGVAAAFISHYLVFGAPGSFNWKGIVRMEHRNSTFIEMGIYDDGPYEAGDASDLDETLVPVPANSFLGFSVDSGLHILPDGVVTVVAGAPRANHSGAVVLLTKEDRGSLVGVHTFKGPRLASSFGYDVAVVDLNNDGWEDIVVGAPHFFMKEGDIGGAVYIYMNKEGRWEGVTPLRLNGTKDSMFGVAVENIGDINLDSYKDIAVGAPLDDEGAGKVYIYLGSAHPIKTRPAQVLTGKEHNIRFFGYSLTGNMDVDANFYPDLAVGSLTDAVVIYRARPIIAINIDVETSVREIDLKNKTCGNNICFIVKAFFTYKTNPAHYNPVISINYSIKVDEHQRKLGLTPRVFLSSDSGFQSDGRVELQSQNQRKYVQLKATVKDNIKDKVRPIFIEVSADVVPATDKTTNGLPALAPILDPFKPNKNVTQIDFVKEGCRDIYVCYSTLKMNCSLHYRQSNEFVPLSKNKNNVAEFVLNYERRDLALLVNVTNSGDYAYETKLVGSFPRGLEYSGVRMVKPATENPVICNVNQTGSQVDCELGNPFKSDSVITFYIILSTNNISVETTEFEIDLQLKTTSNQDIDPLKVKSTLFFERPLPVSGEARPSQVFFGGAVTGESAMKTEEDVGSLIIFTFKIHDLKNLLWKSSHQAVLHIKWPKWNKDGKHLLYLMKVSTYGQGGVRCSPETEINSLNLTHATPSVSETNQENTKEEGKTSGRVSSFSGGKSRVLSMDSGIHWGHLQCSLLGVGGTTIELRTRLWSSTFLEEYASTKPSLLLVKASLELQTDVKNVILKPPNIDVKVDVSPDSDVAQYVVPWWVILLAVLAGILILALMVFLLWKCGFFKRAYRDQYRAACHKAEIHEQPSDQQPLSEA
ncbi:integrin alpha-6 isoform X2 [Oryzias melastigma]|uniref:integrin alpha-6 isoform X2 n=1 Tax=Oryzias melastigma TaxID=30732 RepID=UPI000CF7DD78|nr:integrin alpha-6 isoform X2 [Oryzias melastigma]XP_024142823.1 integrin alpha-6 isoform X2 [Oryzias melastigma]